MIFETSDLTYASPSTITRCGVVRVADDVVTVDSLYQCWVKKSITSRDLALLYDKFTQNILKPTINFVNESSASCIIKTTVPYLFVVIKTISVA